VACCRDGCPSGRCSHLHRGTLELCPSDHWVGHLLDQGPSHPIDQFGWKASSRKSLGVSKVFHLRMMEATVFLGTFPRSVPRHNPVWELHGQFLRPHGLVYFSDIHCQLWFLILTDVCLSKLCPKQFNLPQVDSNQVVETSRMINGNRMHLSSISSLIAKSLNTYVKRYFSIDFFYTFQKTCFRFVIMGYCV
jgi:hypothetical protein